MKIKVIVITGYGINADKELLWAFNAAGGEARLVHLEDLIASPGMLDSAQILAFPGGFSFGDHIASGKVFANIVRHSLFDAIQKFIEADKLIIGICNGFQIITKMGLVPALDGYSQSVSLVENDSAVFEDRWTWVTNPGSDSPWMTGIERLYLPVRHGEGKFVTADEQVLQQIRSKKLAALHYFDPANPTECRYPANPNGSVGDIAAITNERGTVLGMMPHPEAYIFAENHPHFTEGIRERHTGLEIFKNGIRSLQ